MENKGKKKSNSRNDIALDQAILQWIVDDYDISDEKSRKIVGKSGEKSKYEILSDKDKRWQYDQIYYRQEKTEQKTSYSAPEPHKGAQTHSAQSRGEQTCAAPVDPTPEDNEKTSSGKGCAKTGCGCLVVFVVLFILIGLFGGSSSDSDPKFSKGSSNACICFGFNGDGVSAYSATPYAGSALFIDGVGENGNMNSGYGDIKISGKDMTILLSYLCENDNPVITIKSAQ